MNEQDPLLAPIEGAARKTVGGVIMDVVPAGAARVTRTIYGPGFRWKTHMQQAVKTDICMHTHVGFLARGHIHVQFPDGCSREWTAPAVVVLEAGHHGWVIGDEPAVLIEVDFMGETAKRFGLPGVHTHG